MALEIVVEPAVARALVRLGSSLWLVLNTQRCLHGQEDAIRAETWCPLAA